jgi:prepilin-type N-terminal cleavage/methylation domain-containing protein
MITYYAMPKKPQFGFSLIEMAVVLVVLTIILTVIAQPVANQIESRKIADTQKKLEDVKEALYGYALVNGRLPRPAISNVNGIEAGPCATDIACTGFIPWATLGIDKSDAWGAIIRYTVTPAFSSPTFFQLDTSVNPSTKDVITRNSVGATSQLAANVVAVVWSHGKRNFGTDADTGTVRPNTSSGNADEIHNDTLPTATLSPAIPGVSGTAGTLVYSRLPSDNTTITGGEFDDLVSWIPTSILMGKMVQAGKLP